MLINDTSTTSKRSIWPEEMRDKYVLQAFGSELWLNDGNVYVDWCMNLGASTLGYNNSYATPAFSLPSIYELTYAEELCSATHQEAIRFFKSGSDAMSCAVRLARFHGLNNGKMDTVGVFDECYHGSGDWFGPGLHAHGGLQHVDRCVVMKWGEELPDRAKNLCAICIEPIPKGLLLPDPNWIGYVHQFCKDNGVLLISDEIVLGFRDHIAGSMMGRYNLVPDLVTYGKAMSQGYALAAVLGRDDLLSPLKDQVHFSNTNNGEVTALLVARGALQIYMGADVINMLHKSGAQLRQSLESIGFQTRGIDSRFEIVVSLDERKSIVSWCTQHGHLFPGFVCMAVTHTIPQMDALLGLLQMWRKK